MGTYTVKRGDYLAKIAADHGFRDGGSAIWDANPELKRKSGGNPEVLQAGWVIAIPELKVKTVSVTTGRTVRVRVQEHVLGLRVSLRDADNKPVSGWTFVARASGMADLKGESDSNGLVDIPKLPPNTKKVELEVRETHAFGAWKFPAEKIELLIGELDPIADHPGYATLACKKILVNLGYSPGEMNMDATREFRAALRAFQTDERIHPATGLADQKTVDALVVRSNVKAAPPTKQSDPAEVDRNSPVNAVSPADVVTEKVTAFSEFVEPTDDDQTHPRRLGKFHFFPPTAYVSPSDAGKNRWNVNVLRMPARKFVFMDVGRWIGDTGARDFGVIWGRHAYLCSYDAKGGQSATRIERSNGLDAQFFEHFSGHVRIVNHASASWASSQEFDWDHLIVVLPDLHLMTKPTADVWFSTKYTFQAENDLHQFAENLLDFDGGSGKLRVLQIGDSYDLWVDCKPCLYKANETIKVELVEPKAKSIEQLCAWIRDIQRAGAWPDETYGPAQLAFKLLEDELGANRGMVYLYGNHDNYLILPEVCAAAGIPQRRKFWTSPGVFIEHAHRMEARFAGLFDAVPHNYDGDRSGFDATQGAFHDLKTGGTVKQWWGAKKKVIADKWAEIRDQPSYWGEQAQVWLGRQAEAGANKPAHMCVIGHTHIPALHTIAIDAWRKPGS